MSSRLVTPLVINANATVEEVRAVIDHAFAVNAKAQEKPAELPFVPPMEWVLMRRTVAFEVRWYLLKLWDMNTLIPEHADGGATFSSAVGIEEHQRIRALQLSEMTDDTSGPAVLLTGSRVFALIAPELKSATRGGGRSRGLDIEAPAPRTRSEEGSTTAAQPPAAAAKPKGVLRIDAAAYVNAPRRVVPDKTFTLELGLTATPMENVEGGKVAIAFQPNELSIALDIRVECPGFASNGSLEVSVVIPRNDPFTPRVSLTLKALPLAAGVDDELRALQILFSCKGIACGSATYRILVQRQDTPVDIPPLSAAAPRVAIDTSTLPIDLTLRMAWKDDSEASHTLQWSFTSPHALNAPAGKMVRSSPELAAMPISIVDEMAQSDAQEGIELLMGGIAKRIGDEIPAGVWELLRSVSAAVVTARGVGAIPTVLLTTQETRVPWELALVPDPLPDPSEPFLSTQFIVTRWILDDTVRAIPPASISDHDLVAVFGDYARAQGVSELPFARKEADFIKQKHGTALDATRSSIIQLLLGKAKTASGAALAPGILHFAGHGEAARSGTTASFIVLNDGTSLATTYFLNAPALKHSHPLVFLNACQLGAATSTMGQPGGFAGVCVRGECSVVIAPLWSVNDNVAYDVATHFYNDILGAAGEAGIPVAEAMFNSRRSPFTDVTYTDANGVSKTRATATRLAYLVYGHPSFRF